MQKLQNELEEVKAALRRCEVRCKELEQSQVKEEGEEPHCEYKAFAKLLAACEAKEGHSEALKDYSIRRKDQAQSGTVGQGAVLRQGSVLRQLKQAPVCTAKQKEGSKAKQKEGSKAKPAMKQKEGSKAKPAIEELDVAAQANLQPAAYSTHLPSIVAEGACVHMHCAYSACVMQQHYRWIHIAKYSAQIFTVLRLIWHVSFRQQQLLRQRGCLQRSMLLRKLLPARRTRQQLQPRKLQQRESRLLQMKRLHDKLLGRRLLKKKPQQLLLPKRLLRRLQ